MQHGRLGRRAFRDQFELTDRLATEQHGDEGAGGNDHRQRAEEDGRRCGMGLQQERQAHPGQQTCRRFVEEMPAAAQGGEFPINTYTTGNQGAPVVAMNASGEFVVTWISYGQDGSDYGIVGQRFDASGRRVGAGPAAGRVGPGPGAGGHHRG